MIRRRAMMEGDSEMYELKTIANGTLVGLTPEAAAIELDVNGLKEFYVVCTDVRSDNEDDLYGNSGDSYLDVYINDNAANMRTRFGSHGWGFKFFWHFKKAGSVWFCEKSATAYNETEIANSNFTLYTRPIPIRTDVCNKISISLLGIDR